MHRDINRDKYCDREYAICIALYSCCWSSADTTAAADLVERLKGYPATINSDMPILAANAKSILLDDFSAYVIRDVLSLDIRRMRASALALNGQIGMIGFARTGGAYVDVGGAIQAYQNAAA